MAILGAGVKFRYAAVGTNPAVEIGEILNVEPPEVSADEIDVTTHGSPDNWREYIAGLKEGGEVTVEFIYAGNNEGQLALLSDLGGAIKKFEIVFNDGSIWSIDAFVKSYVHGVPLDDKMTGTVGLKVTGKPVFTVA